MFEAKTWKVDLSVVDGSEKVAEKRPALRVAKIVSEIAKARDYIGARPTHVLASREIGLDLDLLDLAGLRVERRPFEWADELAVRLAAEREVKHRRQIPGAPLRIPVQMRLA